MQGDWGSPTVDGRVPFGNGALRGLILALGLADQADMSDVRIEPQVVYTLMQEIYELRDEFQVGHLIRDLSQDLAPNPKATASCDQGKCRPLSGYS